jgi:hypothetical protein
MTRSGAAGALAPRSARAPRKRVPPMVRARDRWLAPRLSLEQAWGLRACLFYSLLLNGASCLELGAARALLLLRWACLRWPQLPFSLPLQHAFAPPLVHSQAQPPPRRSLSDCWRP